MFPIAQIKKAARRSPCLIGAGEGIRTLDPNLGKVMLYQLSYSRLSDDNDRNLLSNVKGGKTKK